MLHRRRRWLQWGGAALLASTVGCDRHGTGSAAGTSSNGAAAFQGVDITGADYGRSLSLVDPTGKTRTLAEFKGKVAAVFFGYTFCPDACPTTMADLALAKKALGDDGARLQTLFVTVDPERDTPAALQRYMSNFDPSFIALRGTPEQTAAAAKEFKVFFAKASGAASGNYSVDHTAGTYLIDPAGKVRVFERYGAGAQTIAADVKLLLNGA